MTREELVSQEDVGNGKRKKHDNATLQKIFKKTSTQSTLMASNGACNHEDKNITRFYTKHDQY